MKAYFGDGLEVPDRLHLVDHTGSLRLSIGTTLGNWTLATSATHGDAVDDVA
jgi:hypothetical protein